MDKRPNPFNELYVTETVSSAAFVHIFSSQIVQSAAPLFLPGNVVIRGMQGCGKSMLLSLLKPDVRIAYAEAGTPFPLDSKHARFIGAGINLTRSGAIDFGQRQLQDTNAAESLPVYFGDFLNYWVVADVLSSLDIFWSRASGAVGKQLDLDCSEARLNEFAARVKADPCWFGNLDSVRNYSELRNALSSRLREYLNFLNFNTDSFSQTIRDTKTTVGEPIARVAEILRESGVIPEDVTPFVRIDQYEELSRLEGKRAEYGTQFREVVNKALSLRNPNVSYRVGTRGYAWAENPQVFGTTGHLEKDRNYKLIDLDEILRRKENRKSWVFPSFAEDVFRKRLAFAGFEVPDGKVIEQVFGGSIAPEDRARQYGGKNPRRAIRLEEKWPVEWKDRLNSLCDTNPLSARLGEAWARQKDKKQIVASVFGDIPPWESHKYWKKERIEAALMQIAGRCGQRMVWAGATDIVELGGGNILVFVSLCQHIWSVWLRTVREQSTPSDIVPSIAASVQAVGIQEASTHWFSKVAEETGGTSRQRFISIMGEQLERELYKDEALSYPGRTGFSLGLQELGKEPELERFLNDCVDYGALVDAPHTTKESNRKARRKWYLNAILSPHFKLPHVRTKEPAYLTVPEVHRWLYEAQGRQSPLSSTSSAPSLQANLFDAENQD